MKITKLQNRGIALRATVDDEYNVYIFEGYFLYERIKGTVKVGFPEQEELKAFIKSELKNIQAGIYEIDQEYAKVIQAKMEKEKEYQRIVMERYKAKVSPEKKKKQLEREKIMLEKRKEKQKKLEEAKETRTKKLKWRKCEFCGTCHTCRNSVYTIEDYYRLGGTESGKN